MKITLVCAILFLHFFRAEAIYCYQCDDSTDDKGIADCIYHTRTLGRQRYQLETGVKKLKELSYLKNCSNYRDGTGQEIFLYCKIEVIQSFGTINGYIRDCSDGINFAKLNVSRLLNPKADNQSTCGFSGLQGATQCVRLCTGDFCNGPLAHGIRVSFSFSLSIFCAVIGMLLRTSFLLF